jgi:phage repressor protein C with HTH and peptisase S24 domain
MLPTFQPGQIVALVRPQRVSVGDIVMFSHDNIEKIKRVARLENGRLYVLGDNATVSTDSRSFGWIGAETVIGKVVWPKMTKQS